MGNFNKAASLRPARTTVRWPWPVRECAALALGLAAVVATLLVAKPVAAADVPEPAAVVVGGSRWPARPSLGLTVGLGVRSDLVRSAGLDPFSTTDGVPQSALSISYGRSMTDRFGMAIGFEWDHGQSTASARGADTSLTIDRLSLGFEGRLSVTNRLVAVGRLAPGLLRDRASLVDTSAPPGAYGAASSSDLHQTSWVPAGDVSAGLACRLADVRGMTGPVFGIWLTAEGGYGYAAAHDLALGPHVETQPGRSDEPLHLGQLAFSGAFLRARIALSF